MRGEDDPLIKFKYGKARILVTSIPLVSGYAESGFYESKVNLVIFMIFLWPREGVVDYEYYYRLATRAGINCLPSRGLLKVNCWNDTYLDEKARIYEENGQSQESRH